MSVAGNWIDDLVFIDPVAKKGDMENRVVVDHVPDLAVSLEAKAIHHADDHTLGTDDKI